MKQRKAEAIQNTFTPHTHYSEVLEQIKLREKTLLAPFYFEKSGAAF